MKKLFFVMFGFISFNALAADVTNGPLQQHQALCNYGYNPNCGQSGDSTPSKKIIRYVTVHVPPKYGALAYDKISGAVGGSMNANSLSEAKKAAIRQCGEKGCKVITWVKNGCIAAAIGKPSKKSSTKFVLYPAAEEQGQAESVALNRCEKAGASECRILTTEGCSIP